MGQRSMLCSTQMIDLEMDPQDHVYPEPCMFLGGMTSFPQPDVQPIMPPGGNMANLNTHHLPDTYENTMFYGIPYHHGIHHHQHPTNLDLGVPTPSNYYVPYMGPSSSGVQINHGAIDHLPSSSNFGGTGAASDDYEGNNHFLDNGRGSYKRKNAEFIPGNSNTSVASSSFGPSSTRQHDGVEGACYALPPPFRGTSHPPGREIVSQRSVRNRLGGAAMDPVLAHTHYNNIQGNYMGQPFPPPSDRGPLPWSHPPAIPYMHRGNVNNGSLEPGNMSIPQYHEMPSRNSTAFVHPSQLNLWHHNYNHHQAAPIHGARGYNPNIHPQAVAGAAPFRMPTTYAAPGALNSSQDGVETGPSHLRPVQPNGFRVYRHPRDGVLPEITSRHRNFPHLRIMPTDGVAILDMGDYYEMESYNDHHRDMRLDIEHMSYEELLALGERIGTVNTGLSEEVVRNQLKTKKYLSCGINLEEAPPIDQESDSCIICQENYKKQEEIGILDCGHEYHAHCLKNWLYVKNVCPICKCEALAPENMAV